MKQIVLIWVCLIGCHLAKEPSTLTYGNSQYYVDPSLFKGNFISAVEYCIRKDMKLVSIESEGELKAIYQWVYNQTGSNAESRSWWTSGSRLANDKDWIWHSTGQLVNGFGKWYSGQPDNYGGNQKCLRIDTNPSVKGYYDDIGCETEIYAICEKRRDRNQNCSPYAIERERCGICENKDDFPAPQ